MKKDLFIYAALCALVAAGCSKQDEIETLQPGQGEALNITISATRHEAPSTRTEYEDATDKLIVKWKSDSSDKLGVFTTENGTTTTRNAAFAVDGDLSADGKTAHFKGSLTLSEPVQEATVYGYYPYNNTAGITPTAIPIDLSSQTQAGITDKESLAHLAAKDYMAATPVTKTFGNGEQNLSLEFNPLLTIMSFKIAQEMNVESIKLEAVGDNNTPFYNKGTVDITTADKTFPITGSGTAQSYVELSVTNGTIAKNATGMFNMMIFPMEPGNMPAQFKVTVITTTGIAYTQTMNAPTQGFERGKRYIKELGLTKDNTPDVWDETPPAADNAYTYSGGEGSEYNPFRISTAKDLAQLAANVNAGYNSDKYFSLTKNINLNEKEWTPIGSSYEKSFKGTFDGNGYSVTGLSINSKQQYLGFFGDIEQGTVKNLNVTGNIISDFYNNGYGCVGGIAGTAYASYIIGCSYSGSVTSINYNTRTGGICGSVSGYVIGCYNTGKVESTDKNSAYCGGIAGTTGSNSGIIGCYNTGNVTGTNGTKVGGIVAFNQAKVRGCYNTGTVTGVTYSDAYCGGILGSNSADAIGCLWVKSSATGTATDGIAKGTSVGTIPPLDNITALNTSISTLNEGIDEWNKDNAYGSERCRFKFTAGVDGNTPPTLTPTE